jgi:hypothetical protein
MLSLVTGPDDSVIFHTEEGVVISNGVNKGNILAMRNAYKILVRIPERKETTQKT